MNRPGHLANTEAPLGSPPEQAGFDVALAAENVRRAGGDRARFAAGLAAALRERPAPDRAELLGFAALAAWRAGALAYRDDALARLDALVAGDAGLAAARALGLESRESAAAFAAAQRTDRFWWPLRRASRGYVCAVGGFAGLGGTWIVPPEVGVPLSEPGAFAIRAGDEWWRLDADVWGHRLVKMDHVDGDPIGQDPPASDPAASIVCTPSSYLAWVHVWDAA